MNASFSFRRFGVMSRMRSARCVVCFGGSIIARCSLIGIESRRSSTSAVMSSAPSGATSPLNGPAIELQFEKRAGSLNTATASS